MLVAERGQNTLLSLENPTRTLVVGRFQPFHNGHLALIEQALELGEVIIVIGSAEKSRSDENPFTCRERFEMLKSVIKESEWDASKINVIPVEDIHSNEIWVSKIEMTTPEFHTVLTGNELVAQLFSERGYVIVKPKIVGAGKFSGSKIRKLISKGKNIYNRVPKSVAEIVKTVPLNFLFQKH